MLIKKLVIWTLNAAVVLFILYAVLFPQGAHAASVNNPTLNAVATEVAGKPVTVHCEENADAWAVMVREAFEPDPVSNLIAGYTRMETPVVYLSPRVCIALLDLKQYGLTDAGLKPAALALGVLAHEGVHQRGIVSESEAECKSILLVRGLAIKYFNVKPKVYVKRVVGKVVKKVLVVNPLLDNLVVWVVRWHDSRPIEYRKDC